MPGRKLTASQKIDEDRKKLRAKIIKQLRGIAVRAEKAPIALRIITEGNKAVVGIFSSLYSHPFDEVSLIESSGNMEVEDSHGRIFISYIRRVEELSIRDVMGLLEASDKKLRGVRPSINAAIAELAKIME